MKLIKFGGYIDLVRVKLLKLAKKTGSVGYGVFMYFVNVSLGKGECHIDIGPDDRLKICLDNGVDEDELLTIIKECLKLGLFDQNCYIRHRLTSKDMQIYYIKNTYRRKNIKDIDPAFALIDGVALKASLLNDPKNPVYAKELYNYAFELYESKSKIVDYNRERAALKDIFRWLETRETLSKEVIEKLVKAHEWAIKKSKNKLLNQLPFTPSALSYNLFIRLMDAIQRERQDDKNIQYFENLAKEVQLID